MAETPKVPQPATKPFLNSEVILSLYSNVIARGDSAELKKIFDDAWEKYDDDKNGYLDADEGRAFAKFYLQTGATLNDEITYDQLIKNLGSLGPWSINEDELLTTLTIHFDLDGDGQITKEELETFFFPKPKETETTEKVEEET